MRSSCPAPTAERRRALGFSLIEALIAFLILAIGLLGISKLQLITVGGAASSQQRDLATHLAQDKIECFRAWPSTCAATYADIDDGSDSALTRGGAVFYRSWEVLAVHTNPSYKELRVTVAWDNKEGDAADDEHKTRQVALDTKISDVAAVVTSTTAGGSTTTTATTTTTSSTTTTSTTTVATTSTTAATTTTSSTTTTKAPTTTTTSTTTSAPTTTTTTTTTIATTTCSCKANNSTPATTAALIGSNPPQCTNACCASKMGTRSKNEQFTVTCP